MFTFLDFMHVSGICKLSFYPFAVLKIGKLLRSYTSSKVFRFYSLCLRLFSKFSETWGPNHLYSYEGIRGP